MTSPYRLYASCAPGLEPLLRDEIASFGGLAPETVPGGVAFSGHRAVIHRVNRRSGVATHLLLRVGDFRATHFSMLEREIGRLPWAEFLRSRVPRTFRVRVKKSKLFHTGAIAERAARVIARALGDDLEAEKDDGVPILIRGEADRFECSIDTSGEPLHRRGYRLDPGPAPLREDLAHALILASGWDRVSPLVDVFAGAGTLPIEAARLARGLDPGRDRSFAFQRSHLAHRETWERVVAEENVRNSPEILGSDRDPEAIARLVTNATRAGVADAIRAETASVSEVDLALLSSGGALVTHPPFGERLDADKDLAPLYRALGARVASLPSTVRLAIYCTDPKLGHRVGSSLETAFVTDAGGLKIRALVGTAGR